MATEVLRIVVNDSDLTRVIGRVDRARSGTRNLSGSISQIRRDARAAGIISLDELPTINRDARLLANTLNIPGFTGASRLFFQGRRGVRAAQLRREAQAVAELDPSLAAQLNTQALLGSAAMVAFVVKIVADTIKKFVEDEKQANIDLENMFQEGLDLTFNETKFLVDAQTGFASWWDQFMTAASGGDFGSAIIEIIKAAGPGIFESDMSEAETDIANRRLRQEFIEAEFPTGSIIQGNSIIPP